MARLNVYVPDDLADRARAKRLNVSALTQAAITAELERHAIDAWLDDLPSASHGLTHDEVQNALDEARFELGYP